MDSDRKRPQFPILHCASWLAHGASFSHNDNKNWFCSALSPSVASVAYIKSQNRIEFSSLLMAIFWARYNPTGCPINSQRSQIFDISAKLQRCLHFLCCIYWIPKILSSYQLFSLYTQRHSWKAAATIKPLHSFIH